MARRRASELPRVGVRQAAPPGSPPCPACGDPLFPWLDADDEKPAVRRCETCGLWRCDGKSNRAEADGVALAARVEGKVRIDDAASLQAMFGAGRWARADREPGAVFPSRESAERLLRAEGLEPARARPRFTRGLATMWQTLINLLTFERNFAPRALAGELRPRGAAATARFAVDAAISVLIAVPAALIAFMVEGLATLAGRGGAVELSVHDS